MQGFIVTKKEGLPLDVFIYFNYTFYVKIKANAFSHREMGVHLTPYKLFSYIKIIKL